MGRCPRKGHTVSKSNVPSPLPCDLYDPGHDVFWLKSIRTIEYPKESCRIKFLGEESLLLIRQQGATEMFNHQISRISAVMELAEIRSLEFCDATGYLYIFHKIGEAYVFSLSQNKLAICEVDDSILRL